MTPQAHLAVLHDNSAGGIYRMNAPVAEITDALTAAGWRCAHLSDGDSKERFLAAAGVALGFPEHYGQNLDALWDCLTDITEPTALVWASWHELAVDFPDDWAAIVGLLRDRAAQRPAFALVLTS